MCGIFALLDVPEHVPLEEARALALTQSRTLRHRGPDRSGVALCGRHVLAHERLAIVDPRHGRQPLRSHDGRLVLAANGEIYNHAELRAQTPDWPYATNSDCEVLLPLYRREGPRLLERLRGMFAFVLAHENGWLIARDHLGIIPLYVGRMADGRLAVASEMKALTAICPVVREFLPGHYQTSEDLEPRRWYEPTWRDAAAATRPADPEEIREALVASVHSHLMSDVPHGVLLSGGLDSSLTAAVAAKRVGELHGARAVSDLRAFSIGLASSPDLAASKTVAASIGVTHEPVTYTAEEGIDALREAIWHTETFEVTTIRAAIPMMLLARHIRSSGVKMVLSGEGADELFGGYLYFRLAPSAAALHEELVRKLDQLHFYDCLRANKAMAAWGVEARVPFLDRDFVDLAMRIRAEDKQPTDARAEKHILREAFTGWLPHEMLWRRKEQFSDGVGLGWADALAAHADRQVSEREFADAHARFPVNTPTSREGYLYRAIFEELFPLTSAAGCVPQALYGACATKAALAWSPELSGQRDPSGRGLVRAASAARGLGEHSRA